MKEPLIKHNRFDNKGFSLIEMLIVIFLLVIVIMITGSVFRKMLKNSVKLMRSEETNIEGVIGLEVLRHDLQQTGFGLPYSYYPVPPVYLEAAKNPPATILLNDAPSGVPRAISGVIIGSLFADTGTTQDSTGAATSNFNALANSDYLTIKGSTVGIGRAPQSWTYSTYTSNINTAANGGKAPVVWSNNNLQASDVVIVIRRIFSSKGVDAQMATDPDNTGIFWIKYSNAGMIPIYAPRTASEIAYYYGIKPSKSATDAQLRMPFNRADYFVAQPAAAASRPTFCSSNTGMLYKTTVNHADGQRTYIPILDCVANMHVVLGWDLLDNSGTLVTDPNTLGDGVVDTWSTLPDKNGTSITSGGAGHQSVESALQDPAQIRTKLKVIKVYILAQNGKKDSDYNSQQSFNLFSLTEEGASVGRVFNLTPDMLNYHWKVYRLIVEPKNLYSNQ